MSPLIRVLARHTYGAVGLAVLVLVTGWILVDLAELSRHIVRAGWHTVWPLYGYRIPVLLHRLIPLALIIGTALTVGFWASDRQLQSTAALGMKPAFLPLAVVAMLLPAVAIWGYSGANQIPPLHQEENRLLYTTYGIGGHHYGSFHQPSGLVLEKHWLVRFKPTGPTVIEHLEAVRLNKGRVLERVSAERAVLKVGGWVASGVRLSGWDNERVRSQHEDETRLPFFRTNTALDYAIGFPDEFKSAYLETMAERASSAGSDPRPFVYERERRA